MGNKPVGTKSDPLVLLQTKILKSQNDFLDKLGEPKSSYIRKLIDAQMSGHEAEISKLKDELRQHEAQSNIIKAQIKELEAADQRKQAASQTREQLLEQAARRIISSLHNSIDFKDRELMQIFKTNLGMINRDLDGNGKVTADELKTITIKKAEAKGLNIYG